MASHESSPNTLQTYLEEGRYPTAGDRVLVTRLGSTVGMSIIQRHLDVRREGASGTVTGWVPGHGGDVWWVLHDESEDVGAYSVDEMAQISRVIEPEE